MSAGSHATKDGYEHIKACATCGQRLVLSGKIALQFETNVSTGATAGWHAACGRPSA